MNYQKLRGKIVEKGETVESLSGRIRINPATFYRKCNPASKTDFSRDEIIAISVALDLTEEDIMSIFFSDDITET